MPDLVSSSPFLSAYIHCSSLHLVIPKQRYINPRESDMDQNTQPIMVPGQTLEAIKGGGGSIKVGTTGTINALMSRELQSVKVGSSSGVPLPNEAATSSTPKARVQADEASTSNSSSNGDNTKGKHTSVDKKNKHLHARQDSRNPFLRSGSGTVDGNGTNTRRKNEKRGSCLVEIVDVKCGVPDKMWANPITSRLKKLTFSKLSEAHGVK